LRRMREQEEKQKAVMAEFLRPPERTPEQLLHFVQQLVSHAAEAGQTEVQIYRFPNELCSDRGRRIKLAARLGEEFGRPTQAGLRILARTPEAARLWAQG
jgi:hypothetical protein